MREQDRVLRDQIALVTRAADFAARHHKGQTRKGASGEPFFHHLAEVACLLATTLDEPNAFLVAAGWLHDTVEKTDVTAEQLRSEFGDFVADIVAEVTDDPSLSEAERRRSQVVETPGKSEGARLLKLSDKTSNLRLLAVDPPPDWDAAQSIAYLEWGEAVAQSCRGLNEALESAFDIAAGAARAALLARFPTLASP